MWLWMLSPKEAANRTSSERLLAGIPTDRPRTAGAPRNSPGIPVGRHATGPFPGSHSAAPDLDSSASPLGPNCPHSPACINYSPPASS